MYVWASWLFFVAAACMSDSSDVAVEAPARAAPVAVEAPEDFAVEAPESGGEDSDVPVVAPANVAQAARRPKKYETRKHAVFF